MNHDEINNLKIKILKEILPIERIDEDIIALKNFQQSFTRSKIDGNLLSYYLVYFLFVDLLNFYFIGKDEKVAWTIPFKFKDKYFVFEHRKLGFGIFYEDSSTGENYSHEIFKIVNKAIKSATLFYKFIASEAVNKSELNVKNQCKSLFDRFKYFHELYDEKLKKYNDLKDSVEKKEEKVNGGILTRYIYPSKQIYKEAEWLLISTIEAFFSWSEHTFIHLAIISREISNGDEISKLATTEWQEKYKVAITLSDSSKKNYYDKLIEVRKQIRNYIAHGSFGKNGEAYQFHSPIGAVPVRLVIENKIYDYTIGDNDKSGYNEALKIIDAFLDYIYNSELNLALFYLHESQLPTIMTFSKNGFYKSAMNSKSEMEKFIKYWKGQFDYNANMDW